MPDRVELTVPGRGEYARTVRMTAAELASRLGMSYDDVDDIRMAAEEAFVYACARAGTGNAVPFVFEVGEHTLTITVGPFEGRGEEAGERGMEERYAAFILESVCDDVDLAYDEAGSACSLTLVKHVAAPEA